MKKYTPIKMIRAGRYKVCFDGLESEVQAGVLYRRETLITDNNYSAGVQIRLRQRLEVIVF